MRHEPIGYSTVPMVFVWLEEDGISGIDGFYGPVLPLNSTNSLKDMDRLAEFMTMPGGVCTRCEMDNRCPWPGTIHRDVIDIDITGKPRCRSLRCGAGISFDLHAFAFNF